MTKGRERENTGGKSVSTIIMFYPFFPHKSEQTVLGILFFSREFYSVVYLMLLSLLPCNLFPLIPSLLSKKHSSLSLRVGDDDDSINKIGSPSSFMEGTYVCTCTATALYCVLPLVCEAVSYSADMVG
jgi:hypothetical protein